MHSVLIVQFSFRFSFLLLNSNSYLQPPNTWISAQLESRELLTVCLKRIKGLNKEVSISQNEILLKNICNQVRLIDAGFIWTEPHSKRIKVKLTVQKEVAQGAILQQTFIVEFTIFNQICDDCQRIEAKDYWKALVQVRQRVCYPNSSQNRVETNSKLFNFFRLHTRKHFFIWNN